MDEVEQICALVEAEGTIAGLRDSALIRLMSDCRLRISEAVAVDVEDIRDSALRVHRSKDRPGYGGYPSSVTLYIGVPTREAIKLYCEAAGITEGPLFRWIRRGDNIADTRLTIDGVRKIIQRRAREAGGRARSLDIPCVSALLSRLLKPGVCCEYAGCRAMEISSDARELRPCRVGSAGRDCTVQIRKMTTEPNPRRSRHLARLQ